MSVVEAEVTYNEFAKPLSEGLEVVGFAHDNTINATEIWSIDKQHGVIEVRIDYISGEVIVEVATSRNPRAHVTKREVINLTKMSDCRRVLNAAV